jgi:putative ABC transport system permease protein
VVYRRLEERLRGVNAIEASALVTHPPLNGGFLRGLAVEGRPASDPGKGPEVTMIGVSSSYFDTVGARVVRGRELAEADEAPGHVGVIVDQRFVSVHFPTEDPLGRQITLTDPTPAVQQSAPIVATIVGVVSNIRPNTDAEPGPVVYLPYQADPQRFMLLVVRAAGDPGRVTSLVRDEMRAVEPDVPLYGIETMDALLAQQRWSFRVFGSMFAIFAAIALVLSAVGLYAVTAYSVTQRTPEIGVRMALGAQPRQVLWLVLRRALWQLAIALPIGVAGALGVGQLLRSLLVQTSSDDPLTIVSITGLMVVISLAACLVPARRATRLDPLSALRDE